MRKKEKVLLITFLAIAVIVAVRNCYTIGYALGTIIETPTED